MPNGFEGKTKVWEKMDDPLIELEIKIIEFGNEKKLKYTKNYHNWPTRSLTWGLFIKRRISISAAKDSESKYNFTITAWRDTFKKRYIKYEYIKKDVDIVEIKIELPALLERSKKILDTWKKEDLELVKA